MAETVVLTHEQEIALASASTYYFAKSYLRNPLKFNEAMEPFPYQKKLYDIVDFGYDMHSFAVDGIKPTIPVRYVVLLSPRQYGKTVAIVTLATALATRKGNQCIGILSMRADKAEKLLKAIVRNIKKAGFDSKYIEKDNKEWVILANGTEIYSYGPSESVRGEALTWLIVDEAAHPYFTEDIFEAALPTVEIAGAHTKQRFGTPSVIFCSTPRGHDSIFLDWYIRGLSMREVGCRSCGLKRKINHRDFHGIQFPEYELPRELPPCPQCGNVNYRYIFNYTASIRVNPYEHPFKTREEIDFEVMQRGNTPKVRQELLGEIISGDLGVFKESWLKSCASSDLYNTIEPKKNVRYVMSGDYGKTHDATVFAIGHYDKTSNKRILDHMFRLEAEGGGLEYKDIRHHFLRLVSLYKPYLLVLDSTGLGNPLLETVKDDLKTLKYDGILCYTNTNGTQVEHFFPAVYDLSTKLYSNTKDQLGFYFSGKSKDEIIENAQKVFVDNMVLIPPQDTDETIECFWKELKRFGYKYNAGRIKYGTQNEHDDTVIAFALLMWGLLVPKYGYTQASIAGQDTFTYGER